MKTVIITPTRNEEKYISFTLESMIKQTVLPIKWIIVNDGSTDNTERIITKFLKRAPFIELVSIPDRGHRKPAQGVIESFYEGYKKIDGLEYDIISKFDADLKFPANTIETICNSFRNDSRLGITGGTRYERKNIHGAFKKVLVPKGFVGGPFKFYRRECFEDINGLIKRAGWDGVDIIKANMKGWRTGELDSLKILHLKPTGTAKGEGLIKACEKYGDVSYYMGGYSWYFLLRVIGRSLHERNTKIGYYMIRGYLKSLNGNEPRESPKFRKTLKRIQLENTKYWIRFGLNSIREACLRK